MKEKAMVLFSGGVDSTTCLGLAIERYGKENVVPLCIVYGQKHQKEVEAAKKILDYYGLTHMELDLTSVFAYSDCSLLSHSGQQIPEATYASQLECARQYVCAVSQRLVFIVCGEHGAFFRLFVHLLRRA